MDKDKIKKLANILENSLIHYSGSNEDAKKLLNSLDELLEKAKLHLIETPVEHVPGRYWFNEGTLSECDGLESAYAKFCIQITMTTEELIKYEKFKKTIANK